MQTSTTKANSPFNQLALTIGLGLVIGFIALAFLTSLQWIEDFQIQQNSLPWPLHVVALPIVLILLFLLKRRSLFFPVKISDLTSWKSDSVISWSPFMTPFHFLGTLASHLVGASVGREASVVLMSAGVLRFLNLSWVFWGPIAMGCGFSAIVGTPWIGLIFMSELYKTNLKQKIFVLISSLTANLLLQTFQIQHLLIPIDVKFEYGFFNKLGFILLLASSSGFLLRFYKFASHSMHSFFKNKSIWFKVVLSVLLLGILIQPAFTKFQSLGVFQLKDISQLELGYKIPFLKLILTLFSVQLGFWGGEFIPLVYAGLHFGANLALSYGVDRLLGAYLSSYLFFACATRLKWTGIFLILSLLGWSWFFWIIFLVQMAVGFSGQESLYKEYF